MRVDWVCCGAPQEIVGGLPDPRFNLGLGGSSWSARLSPLVDASGTAGWLGRVRAGRGDLFRLSLHPLDEAPSIRDCPAFSLPASPAPPPHPTRNAPGVRGWAVWTSWAPCGSCRERGSAGCGRKDSRLIRPFICSFQKYFLSTFDARHCSSNGEQRGEPNSLRCEGENV